MVVEAGIATFTFVLALFLFKKKPSIPPSPAAMLDRVGFCQSLKIMFTSCNFLILTLSVFCSDGALNSFTAVIEEIFSHYDYPDTHSYTSLVSLLLFAIGFVSSLIIAVIADKTKKLKLLLIITNVFSTASIGLFTWFVGLRNKLLSGAMCCLYGCFNIATVPLALEIGSEITYPVGESNSSGVIMTAAQLAAIVLTYTTSALFDSSSFESTKSANISNLISFGLSCLGILAAVLVKGEDFSL